jgi:hypothetical protein
MSGWIWEEADGMILMALPSHLLNGTVEGHAN